MPLVPSGVIQRAPMPLPSQQVWLWPRLVHPVGRVMAPDEAKLVRSDAASWAMKLTPPAWTSLAPAALFGPSKRAASQPCWRNCTQSAWFELLSPCLLGFEPGVVVLWPLLGASLPKRVMPVWEVDWTRSSKRRLATASFAGAITTEAQRLPWKNCASTSKVTWSILSLLRSAATLGVIAMLAYFSFRCTFHAAPSLR